MGANTKAYEEALKKISGAVNANENLNQYKFVVRGAGTGMFALCTASNTGVDGVLQDDPQATGYVGLIGISGVTKIVVGSAGITDGDEGMCDSAGCVTTTTGGGNISQGRALGSGASGAIIPFLLKPRNTT